MAYIRFITNEDTDLRVWSRRIEKGFCYIKEKSIFPLSIAADQALYSDLRFSSARVREK